MVHKAACENTATPVSNQTDQNDSKQNSFILNKENSQSSSIDPLRLKDGDIIFPLNKLADIIKLQRANLVYYLSFGSKNYSRYDILEFAHSLNNTDEFIIIMDDFQRTGEQQTTKDLENLFKKSLHLPALLNTLRYLELG